MASILSALGGGAGIDSQQLVTDLVANSRAAADKILSARKSQLDAKISAMGQVRAALDAFSKSLTSISTSGQTRPLAYSSDSSAIAVTTLAGSKANSSSRITVRQLATSQIISAPAWDGTTPTVGAQLTVRFGKMVNGQLANIREEVAIDLSRSDGSAASVVETINASQSGLSAKLVDTGAGKRILLTGPSGEDYGFTITPNVPGTQSPLLGLRYDAHAVQATQVQGAQNAELSLDGVSLVRASNQLDDVVPGIRLTLIKAQSAPVTVVARYNGDTLQTLVENFVGAFNELSGLVQQLGAKASDSKDAGALVGDRRLRQIQQQLARLSSVKLAPGNDIDRLAQIGIATTRDGQMQINTERLQIAVSQSPERVAALFEGGYTLDSQTMGILSQTGNFPSGSYPISAKAATAAKIEGQITTNAFATPLMVDASNNQFQLAVDAQGPVTIVVREASYVSGDDFVAALNSAMSAALGARAPVAQWTGNRIVLTSSIVGAGSNIIMSGLETSVATRLGLLSPRVIAGSNASGMISGMQATAVRDRLIGANGARLAGLVVIVKQDTPSAMLHIFSGLTGELAQIAMGLGNAGDAVYTAEKAHIEKQQKQVDARAQSLKEQLTRQFTTMEKQVSGIKETQNYLKQQIALWTSNNS